MNYSAFTSLTLKLIGVVFVLSSLLDQMTILFVPFEQFSNESWQIGAVGQIVDRGVVPLVGIAFILVGYFFDGLADSIPLQKSKKPGSTFNLKFPVYILSALCGLIFLLAVPLHLINLNSAKTNALARIEQGAGQGAQQIQQFLTQVDRVSQNPDQVNNDIQLLNQVIEAGQVQGRQLNAQQFETLRQQRQRLQELQNLAKNPARGGIPAKENNIINKDKDNNG